MGFDFSSILAPIIQTGGSIATAEINKPRLPSAPTPQAASSSGLNLGGMFQGIPQWGLVVGGIAAAGLLVVLVKR